VPNRIIKESICTSENLNQLSPEAENLFYRLIVKADDFGCYFGNVKIIKNTCYPLKSDAIKDKQISARLNELVNAGLVILYQTVDGKQYIKLAKWDKHQQKRAKRSKYPVPEADGATIISSAIICNQMQANVPENRESRIENRESRIENTEPSVQKLTLSEFKNVKLSEDELKKLYERFGQAATDEAIEEFGGWMKANGKAKKDHYATLINWIKRNQEKKPSQASKISVIEEWVKQGE
jgi:hypothetical protein